jgi:hypothetical protein
MTETVSPNTRIEGGLIAEAWDEVDMLGLTRQLS